MDPEGCGAWDQPRESCKKMMMMMVIMEEKKKKKKNSVESVKRF